ncbi:hypothetical protein EV138_0375 [Kribbella voronezhensis]|uniref:Uncharacterized protein n=1 Tax=Kribbella voronezhensis TaxID=2512212 RepID=A0A4R7T5M5_9ACTN|nr:hypothetical protein EV138_0375 [Kribbella voronezhensis]
MYASTPPLPVPSAGPGGLHDLADPTDLAGVRHSLDFLQRQP